MQDTTTAQPGASPLWNEILEVTIKNIPCSATISMIALYAAEPPFQNDRNATNFEIVLATSLINGVSDLWLVSSEKLDMTESETPESTDTKIAKLRISCSFDRDMILGMQRGLWPSVSEFALPRTRIALPPLHRLIPNSPLQYKLHSNGIFDSDEAFDAGRNGPPSSLSRTSPCESCLPSAC